MSTISKLVVTTSWDDGSILDAKLAELLEKHSVKGTFYIPRYFLGDALLKRDLLAIDQRFEIGAHTVHHVDLTRVPLVEARREVEDSKMYLEDVLGHSVYMFCYPNGRYNDHTRELVRSSGFIAARTCNHGNFDLPIDPYGWQITLHASNGSPLTTMKIWRKSGISIRSLIDWEIRAKLLFNLALESGGVYHLWGHSWEINNGRQWSKLERVLSHISARETVDYVTNGSIFRCSRNDSYSIEAQSETRLVHKRIQRR